MDILTYIVRLSGIVVFAMTGCLAAGRKRMDLFGAVVLASVTALGGGTVRDLILHNFPVFWVADIFYLLVAAITAVVIFYLVRFYSLPDKLLSVADAFGLALFTALGAQKAFNLGTSPIIAILMGVTTGVVGGMIRDILTGEVPFILRREIYATASICGAIVFVVISTSTQNQVLAILVSIAVTLGIRLSAIKWDLSLPLYITHKDRNRT